jgi:hypothetical protein
MQRQEMDKNELLSIVWSDYKICFELSINVNASLNLQVLTGVIKRKGLRVWILSWHKLQKCVHDATLQTQVSVIFAKITSELYFQQQLAFSISSKGLEPSF